MLILLSLSARLFQQESELTLNDTLKKHTIQIESALKIYITAITDISRAALKQRIPTVASGTYHLNPKGQAHSTLVHVHCDMNDKNGVGVTEIGHDSESSIEVL